MCRYPTPIVLKEYTKFVRECMPHPEGIETDQSFIIPIDLKSFSIYPSVLFFLFDIKVAIFIYDILMKFHTPACFGLKYVPYRRWFGSGHFFKHFRYNALYWKVIPWISVRWHGLVNGEKCFKFVPTISMLVRINYKPPRIANVEK